MVEKKEKLHKKNNKKGETRKSSNAEVEDGNEVMNAEGSFSKQQLAPVSEQEESGKQKKKHKAARDTDDGVKKGNSASEVRLDVIASGNNLEAAAGNVEKREKIRKKKCESSDDGCSKSDEMSSGVKSSEKEGIAEKKGLKEGNEKTSSKKDIVDDNKRKHEVRGEAEDLNSVEKGKKKKRKREKSEGINDADAVQQEIFAEDLAKTGEVSAANLSMNGEEQRKKKKKKTERLENGKDDTSELNTSNNLVDTEGNGGFTMDDENAVGQNEMKKKKKKKKVDQEKGSYADQQHSVDANNDADSTLDVRHDKRKTKEEEDEKAKFSDNAPKDSKAKKRVSFSGDVQVFPLCETLNTRKENVEEGELVRGKRFTREEDEIVKEAVYKYIETHGLGEEGLDKVLNCKSHPEIRGTCWKEIGAAIPYRPYTSVYYRAQVLFRRDASRKWTQEELDIILKHQKEHGNQWKVLADELGKHRWHVKDTWRRIRLPNLKRGHWSQEEYQTLFNLVNADLQMRVSQEKKSKYGMLRDDIPWTAISDKLGTRNQAGCCLKWYDQLTSPMVAENIWADSDDYCLICALSNLDECCVEDVDWDNLLDNRSGEVCRRRWNEMVLHIGHHGSKPFAEQVEVLAQRYCPHLSETRKAWDNKPVVP